MHRGDATVVLVCGRCDEFHQDVYTLLLAMPCSIVKASPSCVGVGVRRNKAKSLLINITLPIIIILSTLVTMIHH